MTEQDCFTSIVNIEPGEEDALRSVLGEIDEQVRAGIVTASEGAKIPFEDLKSVHYARFVVLGAETSSTGETFSPQLALSTDFDGDRSEHLDELCSAAAEGLDSVYQHCAGYSARTPEQRRRYLEAGYVPPHAFYVGTRRRTRDQIREEAKLRASVLRLIKSRQDQDPDWPRDRLAEARREIEADAKSFLPLASRLAAPLRRRQVLVVLAALAVTGFIGLAVKTPLVLLSLPAAWGIVKLFFFALNRREKTDPEFHGTGNITVTPEERSQIQEAAQHEDFELQNQLTHLVQVKPGILRQFALRLVLRVIHFLARNWYYKGKLGGIPSIHFARWMIIDRGRRLLFFSNFDGTWQSYLGDFIDKAATGLTGIWSNSRLFPETHNLTDKGARDEERFKAWARFHQIDTQVWYAAIPGLSVSNINRNTELRSMLEDPRAIPDRHWFAKW